MGAQKSENLAAASFLKVLRARCCHFKKLLLIWHIEMRFAIIKTLRIYEHLKALSNSKER
jgi:hypothetical protein